MAREQAPVVDSCILGRVRGFGAGVICVSALAQLVAQGRRQPCVDAVRDDVAVGADSGGGRCSVMG